MGQDNAIYKLSSKGQNKSKLQKLTSFCSFDLFCPLLEKDNFIENWYIALNSVLLKLLLGYIYTIWQIFKINHYV